MLCDFFSACKLLSNCFVKKILSDAYIGLVGPYQYFGWYGPGLTGHTASAALGGQGIVPSFIPPLRPYIPVE